MLATWRPASDRDGRRPRRRASRATRARLARLVPAAALAAAAAAGVAACGSGSPPAPGPGATASPSSSGQLAAGGPALCASAAQVTSLTVQRSDALPGNHTRFSFPPTEQVNNAGRAQAVARGLCALPAAARTQLACPAEFGITYRLTFTAGAHRFAPVTLNAAGCELVHGLGAVRRVTAATIVWQQLGHAIGIPHPGRATFAGTIASQ